MRWRLSATAALFVNRSNNSRSRQRYFHLAQKQEAERIAGAVVISFYDDVEIGATLTAMRVNSRQVA